LNWSRSWISGSGNFGGCREGVDVDPCVAGGIGFGGGDAVTKAEDDRDFKARWIPFGMRLKARADALGIDWRGLDLENYIAVIQAAEKWAQPEGVQDA